LSRIPKKSGKASETRVHVQAGYGTIYSDFSDKTALKSKEVSRKGAERLSVFVVDFVVDFVAEASSLRPFFKSAAGSRSYGVWLVVFDSSTNSKSQRESEENAANQCHNAKATPLF
jgi:hypothetical protein